MFTILTKIITDRLKNIWDVLGSNSSDFWIGNFTKFADKGLCVSIESCFLLAKSPVRMSFKNTKIFWDAGNFYHCRFQILGNLSGKHFG